SHTFPESPDRGEDHEHQGGGSGQPVNHPDAERLQRAAQPVSMRMVRTELMTMEVEMPLPVMLMCAEMPAFAGDRQRQRSAQHDQHAPHANLEDRRELLGQ